MSLQDRAHVGLSHTVKAVNVCSALPTGGAALAERAPIGRDRAERISAGTARPSEDPGACLPILVVEVGQVQIGLVASQVVELAPVVATTRLPRTPRFVEGIIDWRGQLIPVIDFRARLGLPTQPVAIDQHLVIGRSGARVVALRVDRAVDLVAVPANELLRGAELSAAAHVAGVATLATGLVVVHDLDALLSAEEAVRLDRLLTAARQHRPGGGSVAPKRSPVRPGLP